MRILFICHRIPYPPDHGGKIRAFNMIRHLAREHSVVVASLGESAEELHHAARLRDYGAEIVADILPPAVRWRQAVAALPTSRPSSVAYFWSPRLHRLVEAAAGDVDVILVHCAFMGAYAEGLPSRLRVLDYADLDSAKWAAYARARRLPLSLGYALEAHKLRRHERVLAKTFDHVTVVTSGELEEFRHLGVDRPATVIANGVDTAYFDPGDDRRVTGHTLVFLGRMDYFPNVDGVRWFVRDVFPLIRSRIPDVTLRIVGSSPTPAVGRLGRNPGVTVTGTVPDVRPFLREAAVSIAPLRIARGTQNKILESLAAGVAVVASPAAARGVQAVPGRHLLEAGDPRSFADAVVALLANSAWRRDLVAAARAEVLPVHDWAASMSLLDAVLARRAPAAEALDVPSAAMPDATPRVSPSRPARALWTPSETPPGP